ncbi:MAG: hypothetical protein NUW37_10290, partial [Planctomycetes bacterium]|nr:hypothetical protein [Planctomycetota bacterium]
MRSLSLESELDKIVEKCRYLREPPRSPRLCAEEKRKPILLFFCSAFHELVVNSVRTLISLAPDGCASKNPLLDSRGEVSDFCKLSILTR